MSFAVTVEAPRMSWLGVKGRTVFDSWCADGETVGYLTEAGRPVGLLSRQ